MQYKFRTLAFAITAALSACSGENDFVVHKLPCHDQCTENEKQCTDNGDLEVCKVDDDGCYFFEATSCKEGQTCLEGKCQEKTCENECKPGSKLCTEDGKSMVCDDFDGDGCLENQIQACTGNDVCKNGICTNEQDDPDICEDECSEETATECVDNENIRTCGNYDADTCLEWSETQKCADNAACKDNKCGCVNTCDSNGKTECSGDGFRTCADTNQDGCLEWSSISPCKNGCENDACKPEIVMKPTRYPGNQILSPITAYSVEQMKAIAAKKDRNDNHFAKVGDSHFAKDDKYRFFMYCFSSSNTPAYNLNGETFLEDVIKAFQSDGTNCFSRESVTAVAGWTAGDAISGSPNSPLEKEISAINPRFAFIDYGSNDMYKQGYTRPEDTSGSGYLKALQNYYRSYKTALNIMISNGVIPLIVGTGIMTRQEGETRGLDRIYFTPIFDAVDRGFAEQFQIPYLNLMYAQSQEPIKSNNYGLCSDNLHHEKFNGGCDFTAEGMKYGHNVRNRYAIEMLNRAWKTVVKGETAPDTTVIPFVGSGSKSDPYDIDSLPYTHAGDTKKGSKNYDSYSCASTKSEAGPEVFYKLKLTEKTKIRAFVVSDTNVDADIHLKTSLDDNNCMARGDTWVESELDAGTYYISIDTFTSDAKAGEYMFGVVKCMNEDPLCGTKTTGG